MAKRLEDQLTEAKAALEQTRAALTTIEKQQAAAIEKATAALDAARKKDTQLSEARHEIEHKLAAELKLATFIKEGTRRWHADFLTKVASEVGFHFNEREKIDPKNESYSLYERALNVVYARTVEAHPDVKAALRLSLDASAEAHLRYREKSDAEQPCWNAQSSVRNRERDVREIEVKIIGRAAEKKAAVEAKGSGSLLDPEFEAKAKAARAKLREMVEGKKKS